MLLTCDFWLGLTGGFSNRQQFDVSRMTTFSIRTTALYCTNCYSKQAIPRRVDKAILLGEGLLLLNV